MSEFVDSIYETVVKKFKMILKNLVSPDYR